LGAIVLLEIRHQRDGEADIPITAARSRTVLLSRMHRYWIKGVLERSFFQQASMELGLETTVDAPGSVAFADGKIQGRRVGTVRSRVRRALRAQWMKPQPYPHP
jgi:hypothetical protein